MCSALYTRTITPAITSAHLFHSDEAVRVGSGGADTNKLEVELGSRLPGLGEARRTGRSQCSTGGPTSPAPPPPRAPPSPLLARTSPTVAGLGTYLFIFFCWCTAGAVCAWGCTAVGHYTAANICSSALASSRWRYSSQRYPVARRRMHTHSQYMPPFMPR